MPVSRKRRRLSPLRERKAANIRKNPHPYKDGLGKQRAALAKRRSELKRSEEK